MDHDERERRDWPEDDRADRPPDPDPGAPSEDASREAPSEEPTPEDASRTDAWTGEADRDQATSSAPAEIESWPSQEPPPAGPPPAEEPRAWPTEPPAAGTAPEDTWPTSAPEQRGADAGQPAPSWPSEDAPPQEVEAYPTAADDQQAAEPPPPAHAVPDAEGATGESTQCPRCGTENRPGLSFCRNCGQRLVAAGVSSTVQRPSAPEGTMACPRCGTHNRAGVGFCQNCGANLRGTAEGYVPPAAAPDEGREAAPATAARGGAVLGPVVLLLGVAGLITAYLLPFLYGPRNSLFDRAWGADGYGLAFWNGYPDVGASLADQAYFGLAGPVPLLGLLLLALAVAGFLRAAPGPVQTAGLVVALLWSVGLVVLFVVVELLANWTGDVVGMLRVLTPAGIILFLSSLIVLIGTLTRFSRG